MKEKAKSKESKIVNPVRKCVTGMILAVILSLIVWSIMLVINIMSTQEASNFVSYMLNSFGAENNQVTDLRYEGIFRNAEEIGQNIGEASEKYDEHSQRMVNLTARASYERVSELGDAAIGKLGNGGIVKVENGEVRLGDGMRTGIRNFPEMGLNGEGMFDYITPTADGSRKDGLFYSQIKGPYYYVEIIDGRDKLDYVKKYVDYKGELLGMEAAYDVDIMIVCPDRKNSKYFYNLPGNMVYSYSYTFSEDNGVDAEDYGYSSKREDLLSLNGQINAGNGGETLSFLVREVPELDCVVVIMTRGGDAMSQAIDETGAGVFVIIILTFTFIIWLTSVYGEMTTGLITDKKKEMYNPSRIKLIALSYGIIGALIVFGSGLFFRSLNSIYKEITRDQATLEVIDTKIDTNEGRMKKKDDARKAIYLEYARRVAEMVEKDPQLNNKEELSALNRIIGSEYIMLFDSDGKETGTSSDYINMELAPEDPDHPVSSSDFRRILKGVPGIVHGAFKDEVTGRKLEQYGVRMIDPNSGQYGVLLLAVNPAENQDARELVNRTLRSLTPTGKVSVVIDREKAEITNSSSDEFAYINFDAKSVGFGDNMFRDGVADFARIDGQKHLCISKMAEDGDIIYICTPNDLVFRRGFRYGFICSVGFIFVFAVLFLYLIFGYNTKMIEKVEQSEKPREDEDNKKENILSHSRLMSIIRHLSKNATPERKAIVAFETMIGLSLISMLFSLRAKGEQSDLVFNYILTGKWNRGLNIFSLTSIVMLFCGLVLVMLFVRFVANTLGKMLNSRGKTICRLFSNLINYIGILVFIYYSLSYLGVDTNAILASVGVIGIGVSMGARDLIADIFAGVSMIFEGEYQVGDIVNIDGYRGMVQEVGVRSTRLVGRGGNIKVIGNKDIKSVTNLTKMNSWVAVTIKVDVNYALRDAEEIINQTLPKIAAKHSEIISGPFYKGVLSVEMGFAVLSIIAECYEDDYHKVERALIREVLLALRENNVPVR